VHTLTNGLISTIFGASLINYPLRHLYITWRLTLGVLLLSACSPLCIDASTTPCPPGDSFSQEQTLPTEIPAKLTQVLLSHKGYGLLAKFEEEKTILVLQRPLRSTGHLIFLPQKGLYRQLEAPFRQELLITTSAVHQRDDHGRVETMALEKVPFAKAMVEGFLTVFSGSWESLYRHFQVYFFAADPHWKLGLLPKHAMVSKLISCLILEGESQQMLHLWVHEANGDLTHDRFLESHILHPDHWDDYRLQFEWGH
jgi:outer membrane lipoprotein carrier protein LolA